MAIPRPKILTCITVPSPGWDLDVEHGATSNTITVPAGDYFMSQDDQSDDFLAVVTKLIDTEISGTYASITFNSWIDFETHKVKFYFSNASSVSIVLDWTSGSGNIGKVLGFDTSASDSLSGTSGTLTADYQHAYGWYANEDGLLRDDTVEPIDIPNSPQSISPSGYVKTQHIASRFTYRMQLQFLKRDLTFSRGVSYTEESKYPYSRNKGLECWFREAKKGTRFRVYRQGYLAPSTASGVFFRSSATSSTITYTSGALQIDPQQFKGALTYQNIGPDTRWMVNYIESHTATVLTLANHYSVGTNYQPGNEIYLIDGTYETYVLDLSQTSQFAPTELPNIDRYDFQIDMLRYES